MTLTRSQFIERATRLSLTVSNPIEAIADLVECNFGKGFQPEPDQPTVIVTFLKEVDFYSRRLLSSGQWQFRRGDGKGWVNEDPDPIQRKLAELLLDSTPAPALTFEREKWRRVEETETVEEPVSDGSTTQLRERLVKALDLDISRTWSDDLLIQETARLVKVLDQKQRTIEHLHLGASIPFLEPSSPIDDDISDTELAGERGYEGDV